MVTKTKPICQWTTVTL